jgi:arylsulfatase A-like enzyme
MAYLKNARLEPGDHGVRSAFDVVPTLVDLLGEAPVAGLSGTSLLYGVRSDVAVHAG